MCGITLILWEISKVGYKFSNNDIVMLSPYLNRLIKRFGEYMVDLEKMFHN
ncbi:hypothetical protein [Peribacillus simplex]|uniref:hypothetical protein n=1 Tax=Peribacillus simplex TaxID=1478 RepID=UPI0021AA134E|nr:hypothetical protein [Peribacillus simplex]